MCVPLCSREEGVRASDERDHEAEIQAEVDELQGEMEEDYQKKVTEYKRQQEEWKAWRRKRVCFTPKIKHGGLENPGLLIYIFYRIHFLMLRKPKRRRKKRKPSLRMMMMMKTMMMTSQRVTRSWDPRSQTLLRNQTWRVLRSRSERRPPESGGNQGNPS